MKQFCAAVLLTIALTACHGYQLHPGSINTFDSVTADTLTSVKQTIDTGRTGIASGALPASLKTPLNDLVNAYNTATSAYTAWRTLITNNPNANASAALNQIQAALAAVTQALANYTQAGGK